MIMLNKRKLHCNKFCSMWLKACVIDCVDCEQYLVVSRIQI
ncbi:hypothetical protein HMPREF1582_00909 [Gardnerella vaginalis JCP8151A]|nr:hypothetical protein HMPREF1582_00909 [Gardnerella vaginalis JCP8151A]